MCSTGSILVNSSKHRCAQFFWCYLQWAWANDSLLIRSRTCFLFSGPWRQTWLAWLQRMGDADGSESHTVQRWSKMYKVQTSPLNFLWFRLAWITCCSCSCSCYCSCSCSRCCCWCWCWCCCCSASYIILWVIRSHRLYLLIYWFMLHVCCPCLFVFFANLFLYAFVALCQMSMHLAVRPFLVLCMSWHTFKTDGKTQAMKGARRPHKLLEHHIPSQQAQRATPVAYSIQLEALVCIKKWHNHTHLFWIYDIWLKYTYFNVLQWLTLCVMLCSVM